MNERPRQILCELIAQHGPELSDDPWRCEALLNDLCAPHKREISALVMAQRELVAHELRQRSADSVMPLGVLASRLASRLCALHPIEADSARWAVDSWALALGLLTRAELREAVHATGATAPKERPAGIVSSVVSGIYSFGGTTYSYFRGVFWKRNAPAPAPEPLTEISLPLKCNLNQHPSSPVWYKHEVGEVEEYITAEESGPKPLVLTGYEGFGGSFIAECAVAKSAAYLSSATGVDKKSAVFVIEGVAEKSEESGWSLNIDGWLRKVNESPKYKKFRERFSHALEPFDQPGRYVRAGTHTYAAADPATKVEWRVPFLGAFSVNRAGAGKTEVKIDFQQKDMQTQVRELLVAIGHGLPDDSARGSDDRGLPCRVVLVVYGVEDCNFLKCLEAYPRSLGALRVVVILDKRAYDEFAEADPRNREALKRRFEVLECMPLWDANIARDLCRHYFEVEESHRDSQLYQDFLAGLNFRCRGLPANFKRIMRQECRLEDERRVLVLDLQNIKRWQDYAVAGERLGTSWKSLLTEHVPAEEADDPRSDLASKARLLIHLAADLFVSAPRRSDEIELLDSCKRLAHAPATLDLTGLCRGVINTLSDERAAARGERGEPRRVRPGRAQATRPLHFIWIVDCSSSMREDGKIQAVNNAIREAVPYLKSVARENPNAEVLLRVVSFSSGAHWHVATPTPAEHFRWNDLTADGDRDTGEALRLVAEQLRIPPMSERALPPVLALITDGPTTDDFHAGLKCLLDEYWGRKAVRLAVAVGAGADLQTLEEFIGNPEMRPLQAHDPETLVNYVKWVSTGANLH